MRMSITTTSGRSDRARRTASWPDGASPTTRKPSCRLSRAARPMRTTSWSSAMRMRMLGVSVMTSIGCSGRSPGGCDRHGKGELRAPSGSALDGQGRAEQLGTASHVGQAVGRSVAAALHHRFGVEAGSIVADLQLQAALRAGQSDIDTSRLRVAQDVAEGLVHDLVQLRRLLRASGAAPTRPPRSAAGRPACWRAARRPRCARSPRRSASPAPRCAGRRWWRGCRC